LWLAWSVFSGGLRGTIEAEADVTAVPLRSRRCRADSFMVTVDMARWTRLGCFRLIDRSVGRCASGVKKVRRKEGRSDRFAKISTEGLGFFWGLPVAVRALTRDTQVRMTISYQTMFLCLFQHRHFRNRSRPYTFVSMNNPLPQPMSVVDQRTKKIGCRMYDMTVTLRGMIVETCEVVPGFV